MNVGRALRKARNKRKLRQGIVAEGAGITQTYLSQLENNLKAPSLEVLSKLASYFGVPLSILLFESIDDKDITANRLRTFKNIQPLISRLLNDEFNI